LPKYLINSDERKVELEAPLLVHKKPLTTRKAAESPTFMEAPPTPRTDGAKRRALNTIKARQQGDAYRQSLQETLSEMLRAEFRTQGTPVSNEHLQRSTHDALQSVSGHSRAEIRTQLVNLGVAVSDSLVSNESHYLSKALRYLGDMVVEGLVGRAAHAASPSTQAPTRQLGRGYAGITQAAVKRLKLPGADADLLGKKASSEKAKGTQPSSSQPSTDNKASAPARPGLMQRRDAMLREIHGEHYIPESTDATIVVGSLVGAAEDSLKTLKGTGRLAESALRAERDRVLSQSLLVGVFAPKIQKDAEKRHQARKEKVRRVVNKALDIVTHPTKAADMVRAAGNAISQDLIDRRKQFEITYEAGDYFKAGKTLSPLVDILPVPSLLSAGVKVVKGMTTVTKKVTPIVEMGTTAARRAGAVLRRSVGGSDINKKLVDRAEAVKKKLSLAGRKPLRSALEKPLSAGVSRSLTTTAAAGGGVPPLTFRAQTHMFGRANLFVRAPLRKGVAITGSPTASAGTLRPTRVPRAKTKGVAEGQLTANGLSKPEALLPKELSMVKEWQGSRNVYLKKWRNMDISNIPVQTRKLLVNTKADRVVKGHMKPDDLAAILKEGRGGVKGSRF
jgi:hypothetical protein